MPKLSMTQDSKTSSSVANSLTGPLQMITICTNNLNAIKDFYVKALGMNFEGPYDIEEELKPKLRIYWDIPESLDFQVYHLYQEKESNTIDIRLLLFNEETDSIHSPSAAIEIGPYSAGFFMKDIKAVKELMKSHNYSSLSNTHVKEAHVNKIDEADRVVSLFLGPDNVKYSFVKGEKNGLKLTTFIAEQSDKEIEFYTHVLGMQLISDFQGISKRGSKESNTAKITYRSSTIVSRTSKEHEIHILSHDGSHEEGIIRSIRIPHRGITMYTFMTEDVGEILARAHAKEVKVYRSPRKIKSPILGEGIGMTLLSPSGFVVEIFSPSK